MGVRAKDVVPWRGPAQRRFAGPKRLCGSMLVLVVISLSSCRLAPSPPHPYLAFVACEKSNTVAVVNLEKLETVLSIPVATGPIQVEARPSSHQLEILSATGILSAVDFPELEVVQTARVASGASQLEFSPHGKLAYVLDPGEGQVVVIDASRGEILRRIKLGRGIAHFALTPNAKTLVASNSSTDQLLIVSARSGKILGRVGVGKAPGQLVVLPDGSKVFVADAGEDEVSAVDIASRQLLSNIELGAPPSLIALKPDGGELFVFADRSATLSIIDTTADDIEQSYPTSNEVRGAVFTPNSDRMCVLSADGERVIFFDVSNRSALAAIPIGTIPAAAALTPDGRFLAVGGRSSGTLAVLRTQPPGLVTEIPVGERPVDVSIPGWMAPKDWLPFRARGHAKSSIGEPSEEK